MKTVVLKTQKIKWSHAVQVLLRAVPDVVTFLLEKTTTVKQSHQYLTMTIEEKCTMLSILNPAHTP